MPNYVVDADCSKSGTAPEPRQCLKCRHRFRPLVARLIQGKQAELHCAIRGMDQCVHEYGLHNIKHYDKAPCRLVNATEDCQQFEPRANSQKL